MIENFEPFLQHAFVMEITSPIIGFIEKIKVRRIGIVSRHAGAGWLAKDERIDTASGIYLNKKVGELILEGELLATIYGNDEKGRSLRIIIQTGKSVQRR